MNQEKKQCQNCKQEFTIEPDDFAFYEKIKVPAPTWCPECRLQRRFTWRNESSLYKRKCNVPGHTEDIISIYLDPKFRVYDHAYWWSDEWDAMQYGRDYDFSKPFFQQFLELLEETPLINLIDSKSVNTRYCNYTVEHKNCYLISAGWSNEDSSYSNRISFCKETLDSYNCHRVEFGYENVYCKESYRLFWSRNSENCNDSYFLYDCRGCSNCVGCTGLRNKQYYIFNNPYPKEEYFKKLKELSINSVEGLERMRKKFEEMYMQSIHKYAQILKSENVIGDNIEESRNCYWCFDVAGNAENSKYCNWAVYGMKDCYDSGPGAGGNSELTYEGVSVGVTNSRVSFGVAIWYSQDISYSYNCHSSHNLFGCVSLRNKEYCILNRQYTKEEYETLLPKIIEYMNKMPYTDAKGKVYKYGEFFPPELSPFAYNETVAQDYIPLKKEQALAMGWDWKDPESKQYKITIAAKDLPSIIKNVDDSILKETIGCAHEGKCNEQCTTAFKIIPDELKFYKKMNLPLPRLCPNCRHYQRLKQRNPLKLWHRQCVCDPSASSGQAIKYKNTTKHSHHPEGRCPNEFETSYAPERSEIIYCERCYQAEVV